VIVVLGGAVFGLKVLNDKKRAKLAYNEYLLANTYFEKQDWEKAEKAYLTVLQQFPDSEYIEEVLYRLGVVYEKEDKDEIALEFWRRLLDGFPGSRFGNEALYRAGFAAERLGEFKLADEFYQGAREQGEGKWSVMALCGQGRLLEQAEDYEGAQQLYKRAMAEAEGRYPEAKRLAMRLLGNLNVKMMFSGLRTEDTIMYKVQPGDTVSGLGERFNTTKAIIRRANELKDDNIRVGQVLKIKPANFKIVIDKSDFTLTLYKDGEFFKQYPVGLGRKTHETPAGRFVIKEKIVNPTWYKPSGEVIPPLDPKNELGTRWLGLEPLSDDLPSDLGIHSTIDPASIGWASSSGCPRMYTQDAEELFDLVTIGTEVEIVE